MFTTIATVGIALAYAAQINLGTPHLLHLGLPAPLLSIAWLAGPLSGLIVQPIVGHFSDLCTHPLGRRRPFLLIGAILTSLSLVLFANAHRLGPYLHGIPSPAVFIAILGFFTIDFSVQAVQAPLRALVVDVFPPPQRHTANAQIGLFTGVGNLAGGLLAGAGFAKSMGNGITDVDVLFNTASFFLITTVLICVWNTPEKRRKRSEEKTRNLKSGRTRSMLLLRRVPAPFWSVFAVQLCTWCGFFTLLVYVNTWVGTNVFGGDASGDPREQALFQSGVRFGGIANALNAVITIAYSSILPALVRTFGVKRVYAFSQFVEAVCLMSTPFIRAGRDGVTNTMRVLVLIVIGSIGIVWATTLGLPWTLVGNALESDDVYRSKIGLFTTLFNASQSFPQLVVAFIAYPILRAVEDCSVVMFLGGVCAAVGGILVYVLDVDDVKKGTKGLERLGLEKKKEQV